MKKVLPIGRDDFRKVRENKNCYYVDKSIMIKDFIELNDEVALITRPRHFGKTLNMTMLREFFDITADSRDMFKGLAIMDTEYADLINTTPVVYFSFKDCSASNPEKLRSKLIKTLFPEYRKYYNIFSETVSRDDYFYSKYFRAMDGLNDESISWDGLEGTIQYLLTSVTRFYGKRPILFIDEYDQPIASSYEHSYRKELNDFFEGFFGFSLKGNQYLSQALLTGFQRVAKESIFSKLNHLSVYSVLDEIYSPYFGLNTEETENLLKYYGLELNEEVKNQYDGYVFGKTHMYNPWSILNYASKKVLAPYWINTSTNYLVKDSLGKADSSFKEKFNQLIMDESVNVSITLETAFVEMQNNSTLWGLLVNSGYITIEERIAIEYMKVRIPNNEVKSEFQKIVAEQANIQNDDLKEMLNSLLHMDMDGFMAIYRKIVLSCTSYFDAKENAYHMLFLGMCISLRGMYKITSNIESGHGRSDITMESLSKGIFHVIIEFKQGEDISRLKEEALSQIIENQYYAGLSGQVLCIGIAHNIKYCEIEYKLVQI